MEYKIKNIGWTLGNDCPCTCKHCYSFDVRKKGKDLSKEIVDRIIDQILKLDVDTVNIGGNEPVFTSGLDAEKSLLPYILRTLHDHQVDVGITTSGISMVVLRELFPESLCYLNDVDISLDSPYEEEHNKNRGGDIFRYAIKALEICMDNKIHSGIIMCAMNWNFTVDRLKKMVELAREYDAAIRINILKPTEERHVSLMPSKEQIADGYSYLFSECDVIDLSEPILAGPAGNQKVMGCPCGETSLRINSITPDGRVMLSPCVYMHDFRVGNLMEEDIMEIISSKEFASFQYRKNHYEQISECRECKIAPICRGGCFASAYLNDKHKTGEGNLLSVDPYCLKNTELDLQAIVRYTSGEKNLVHQNYLCTCIVKPKDII